jgi:hypothetical protein
MVVSTCNQIEGNLPASVYAHMIFNVILDFVVGLVPFVGDLADAMYKCNTRNAVILEKFLKKRGEQNLQLRTQANPDAGGSPGRRPDNGHSSGNPSRIDVPSQATPVRPQPARLREGNGESRSNSSGRKKRQPDVEMGTS